MSFLASSVSRLLPPTTTATTREMSSYEWKNMSKQAQKANKDFAELTKQEIRKAGEDEIDKVEKALKAMEPFNDVFEVWHSVLVCMHMHTHIRIRRNCPAVPLLNEVSASLHVVVESHCCAYVNMCVCCPTASKYV